MGWSAIYDFSIHIIYCQSLIALKILNEYSIAIYFYLNIRGIVSRHSRHTGEVIFFHVNKVLPWFSIFISL